jgi:DNA-binding transcriptional regulator WhiA
MPYQKYGLDVGVRIITYRKEEYILILKNEKAVGKLLKLVRVKSDYDKPV